MEEEETAEEDAPGPLVTHVNNFEVYINIQQICNSNGLYAHKCYMSENYKGVISEYKGVLHCEVYNYEEFLGWNYGSAFVWTFFHKENENA